jgi:RimJ/RimL family protein N-acetyltransferase
MSSNVFTGAKVRLAAFDPENEAKCIERWNRDSEYQQLLSARPAYMWSEKMVKEWFSKPEPFSFNFAIRALPEDKLIGTLGLDSVDWTSRNCWVGIGIGERDYWGKGYGTEAMRLALRFAFEELNLNRVSLDVFQYNERAIHSYEKAGFRHEGTIHGWMNRGGQRLDVLFMGALRTEWEETLLSLEKK